MADNASNNNELYDYLSQSLSVAKKERLRCVGHIIDLIVKALIYGKGVSKLERLYLLAWRKPANDSYDLSQDALTDEDWQQVEQLVKILKPFVLATKRMEGDANSPGVEGSYGALWESITNIELLY